MVFSLLGKVYSKVFKTLDPELVVLSQAIQQIGDPSPLPQHEVDPEGTIADELVFQNWKYLLYLKIKIETTYSTV